MLRKLVPLPRQESHLEVGLYLPTPEALVWFPTPLSPPAPTSHTGIKALGHLD